MRRLIGAVAVVAVVAVGVGSSPAAARAEAAPTAAGPPAIELAAQTAVAAEGGSFVARVRLRGVPPEGSIRLRVHQRIRSRSELAQSMAGDGLRCCVFDGSVTPLSALPEQPDGTRRLVLSLDSAQGGLALPTEGVYPLEVIAQDVAGSAVASLVTHLIVPPEPGDDAPDLGVAVLADAGLPPALQPDGTLRLDRDDVDRLAGLVAGLAAVPDVPVTVAARPETLDALQRSAEPGDAELVRALRGAVAGRRVLAEPYVSLDVDALAEAEVLGELAPQLDRGRAVAASALGVTADDSPRWVRGPLGPAGLGALAFTGTTRVVVDDAVVDPLPAGIIGYSLAQPFLLALPEGDDGPDRTPGDVQALSPDPTVLEHLRSDGSPGLVVSRVLAELALLRLEQPSVARSVVLPVDPDIPTETLQQLLQALASGRPFEAMPLGAAFEHSAPVLDVGGNPAARPLVADQEHDELSSSTARRLVTGRAALQSFTGLVEGASALPDRPARHLLVAAAAGLDDDERRAHLDAATRAIDDVEGAVSTPPTFTLTLTDRDGTIPLTIRNDAGVPLRVSIRLRSQKLEFPEGDTIEQVLTEETTRIDLPVRSRATGAFPLVIDVRTPDGQRSLATSRYTVRSTAVSGAGLLLSVGAGLFLAVWWARHWRRTRRSRKLVSAGSHPSAGPEVA